MVLVLGMFLINALCAFVPCQREYPHPVPVPYSKGSPQYHLHYKNILTGEVNDYIVKTSGGLLQGFPMKTIRDRDIFAFTGIPYAEPPVGELRYRVSNPKSLIFVFHDTFRNYFFLCQCI